MVSCFPRASRSSRLPFIVPSVAAACFWLVGVCKISIGSRLRPGPSPSLYFFVARLHSTPQTMGQRPPHVPPRSHLLSNAPLTVDNNFRLVVVSPIKRRPSKAKGPPISLFFWSIIRPPKRRAAVLPTRSDPASPLLQRTL
jgi:hypothetical protein